MNEKRMAMKGEEGWTAQDHYHVSKRVDLFASLISWRVEERCGLRDWKRQARSGVEAAFTWHWHRKAPMVCV